MAKAEALNRIHLILDEARSELVRMQRSKNRPQITAPGFDLAQFSVKLLPLFFVFVHFSCSCIQFDYTRRLGNIPPPLINREQ